MKKSLVLFAAVAALASCSDNLELSSDLTSPKAILFTTYTNIVSTRGVDTKVDNLDSIRVTAIAVKGAKGSQEEGDNYFSNLLVTSSDKGSTWTYSGTQYFWPAYNLNFYAHNFPNADSKKDEGILNYNAGTDSINKRKHSITFTTGADIDSLKDIVVAKVATVTQDSVSSSTVVLPFTHALTKINVQAKNLKDSLYKIEVKGIKFANVVNKGTYTFGAYNAANDTIATGTWATVDTTKAENKSNLVDYRKISKNDKKKNDTIVVLKKNDYENIDFNTMESASWMFIPQTLPNWTTKNDDSNADSTNVKGRAYLAVLAKITSRAQDGSVLYPASVDGADADGFAWIAIPFGANFELKQGKAYTLSLNFFSGDNGGAGMVDPEEPADRDGDGSKDHEAGQPIIPGTNPDNGDSDSPQTIIFSVTVSDWDKAATTDYPSSLNNLDL